MHAQGGLPIPGIVHIEQPYWFERGRRHEPRTSSASRPRAGSKQKILEVGADKVAAFIGEPVQGAGGVIVPPTTYWPEIQRICDKYGILLVVRRGDLRLRPHRPVVRLRDTSASSPT